MVPSPMLVLLLGGTFTRSRIVLPVGVVVETPYFASVRSTYRNAGDDGRMMVLVLSSFCCDGLLLIINAFSLSFTRRLSGYARRLNAFVMCSSSPSRCSVLQIR